MSEPNKSQTIPRKVCLADFFTDEDGPISQYTENKHNKNYSNNDNFLIAKNQREFGHRKRIKP
jgi:hypothetical protein